MTEIDLDPTRERTVTEPAPVACRYQRIKASLPGRYMLEDEREFTCMAVDMSPGGMELIGPVSPVPNERVIVYLDGIGRIDGICVSDFENGFAMTINGTWHRHEVLAEQLAWLADRQRHPLPDAREFGRITLSRPDTTLTREDGTRIAARVVDLSRSGVALEVNYSPAIDALVYVGKMKGHVVRLIDDGIVVQFVRLIPLQNFDVDIVL